MKTLIITAHPSSKGFTHKIAKTFAENARDAEILDLYNTELAQDFLRFEDMKNISEDPKRSVIQKKISEAEEIVFVHPMWWGGAPAILKNFIDQNFTTGFAFLYENGKPKGLLKDKSVCVFMTADAPTWIYQWIARFPKQFWAHSMLGVLPFCGLKIRHFEIFGNMHKRSEEEKSTILKKIEDVAKGRG
jgi:NAD(P)H dehydrogenase (quinone)